MPLCLATHSLGKLDELRRLAPELARSVRTLGDLGIAESAHEEETTFEEIALAKATTYAAWSRLPTLADDSGLCLDAWNGGPGVRTARLWPELSWPERCARICREAPGGATFVCVLALVVPQAAPLLVRGEARGAVAPEPRGSGGFGYDPVFLLPDLGRTFAELTSEEKDGVSHRGQAFRALRCALEGLPDVAALLWTP